jgi:LPS-assembly lipoprotein
MPLPLLLPLPLPLPLHAPVMRRRGLLALWALALLVGLAGCGFALRTSLEMPFATIGVTPESTSGVAGGLVRYFGDAVRPVAPPRGGQAPEVIVDVQQESQEKVIVGVDSSGLVREFELRLSVRFKVRTPLGHELIASTVIEQARSISFNESAVLSKDAEEAFLYRDMQSEIVQQLARRLAVIHLVPSPSPSPGS